MSPDALWLLFLAGAVILGLTLARLWLGAFANLLWMVLLRPYLVASSLAGVVTMCVLLLDWPWRRQGLVATRYLIVIIVAPILAQSVANLIARWRAEVTPTWRDPLAKDFIFQVARQAQQDAFVASLASPPPVASMAQEADGGLTAGEG
jgi:hypothetical protein